MADHMTRSNRQPMRAGIHPDKTGGMYQAGLLPAVSLISRGEARGHGFWVDRELLASLATALQEATTAGDGIKCRYTHPFASADSLGRFLGRVTAVDQLATSRALAEGWIPVDVHVAQSAHKAPEGNLAEYVMGLSAEDSEALGLSAVFYRDRQAEVDYMLAHGGQLEAGPDGTQVVRGFESPDPDNVHNLPHARLAKLWAADVVGDPAANPGGLRGPVAGLSAADDFWRYALGITSTPPAIVALDVDPERLRLHLQQFLERNEITLTTGADDMTRKTSNGLASLDANGNQDTSPPAAAAEDTAPAADADNPEAPAGDQPATEDTAPAGDVDPITQDEPPAPADQAAADDAEAPAGDQDATAEQQPQQTVALSELPKWQKLGPNAMTWLSEGKSYEQALELRAAEQDAELAELRQLAQAHRGEADPVSGNLTPPPDSRGTDDGNKPTALGAQDKTAAYANETAAKIARLNQPSIN